MEIVLPLLAADLDRYLELQRPTFERHYADLGRTSIIARPEDADVLRAATAELADVVVVDERALVPEAWLMRRKVIGGRNWFLQQLLKLAAVHDATGAFVLVLDADVVAVRPVRDADLVQDGRALRPREPVESHPAWVDLAGRALDVAPLDYSASVTPSVLSREAVRRLARHATTLRSKHATVRVACAVPGLRRRCTSWRGRLIGRMPWTEYQLYDTFLHRLDDFNRFHVVVPGVSLYGNCVWRADQFENWNPSPDDPSFFFSVVQGTIGIGVDAIATRIFGEADRLPG